MKSRSQEPEKSKEKSLEAKKKSRSNSVNSRHALQRHHKKGVAIGTRCSSVAAAAVSSDSWCTGQWVTCSVHVVSLVVPTPKNTGAVSDSHTDFCVTGMHATIPLHHIETLHIHTLHLLWHKVLWHKHFVRYGFCEIRPFCYTMA